MLDFQYPTIVLALNNSMKPDHGNDGSTMQYFACGCGQNATGQPLCAEAVENWCQRLRANAHPVFLIISIICLLLTLFFYLVEETIRSLVILHLNILFQHYSLGNRMFFSYEPRLVSLLI